MSPADFELQYSFRVISSIEKKYLLRCSATKGISFSKTPTRDGIYFEEASREHVGTHVLGMMRDVNTAPKARQTDPSAKRHSSHSIRLLRSTIFFRLFWRRRHGGRRILRARPVRRGVIERAGRTDFFALAASRLRMPSRRRALGISNLARMAFPRGRFPAR